MLSAWEVCTDLGQHWGLSSPRAASDVRYRYLSAYLWQQLILLRDTRCD